MRAVIFRPRADSSCVAYVQVAIKKVLQDKRFKNRELQIMKMMGHPNVVDLKHCFYTNTDKDEVCCRYALHAAHRDRHYSSTTLPAVSAKHLGFGGSA